MDMEKLKGDKKNPVKDVFNKFKYSFAGMVHCFKNETSFIFETVIMVFIIIFGIVFQISFMEWIFSVLSMLLIMEVEFLNTAIEATVDMVTKEFHPLAKVAKDCGSAATCMASLMATIVNGIIFLPRIISLFIK